MHDPLTVAFDIKSPIKRKSEHFPKGYRETLITIWHVDPLKFAGKICRRDDDSCGWFQPPVPITDWERAKKVGIEQWYDLFGKRRATAEGASYARVCNEPTTYEAVYWAWRSLKSMGRRGWRYGEGKNVLTPGELQRIQELASNPVDNFKQSVAEITDAEKCGAFFARIYRCYLSYHRPWYRHPRWHFWHWRIQVHHWQRLRRWLLSRCAGCGKRFPYGYSPTSFGWDSPRPKFLQGEQGVYHSECANHAMTLMRNPTQGNA